MTFTVRISNTDFPMVMPVTISVNPSSQLPIATIDEAREIIEACLWGAGPVNGGAKKARRAIYRARQLQPGEQVTLGPVVIELAATRQVLH